MHRDDVHGPRGRLPWRWVNGAPAMHAADASLSVEQAAEAAREAADFVLLERGLDVMRRGIEEGRRTGHPGRRHRRDAVDPELIERPERWDTRFTGRYMV